MAISTIYTDYHSEQDHSVWDNLKQAIASSSGFRRWRQEQNIETQSNQTSLDTQVSCYLRETLETLAY